MTGAVGAAYIEIRYLGNTWRDRRGRMSQSEKSLKLLMKYVWNSHIDCRPVII